MRIFIEMLDFYSASFNLNKYRLHMIDFSEHGVFFRNHRSR